MYKKIIYFHYPSWVVEIQSLIKSLCIAISLVDFVGSMSAVSRTRLVSSPWSTPIQTDSRDINQFSSRKSEVSSSIDCETHQSFLWFPMANHWSCRSLYNCNSRTKLDFCLLWLELEQHFLRRRWIFYHPPDASILINFFCWLVCHQNNAFVFSSQDWHDSLLV